jgi:hypothetical protein
VKGARLSAILRSGPDAATTAAGVCCSVVSGGRPVAGGLVSSAGGTVPRVAVRVPGARALVSGARTTFPGEGAVPLSAESHHLTREFSMHFRSSLLCRLANARESGRGKVSVMRSAQSAAASSSTSGWQARVACTLAGSRLARIVRRK